MQIEDAKRIIQGHRNAGRNDRADELQKMLDDFEKQFHYFINANQEDILYKKINAFKKIRSFSCFQHYKSLVEILN